MKKSWMTCLWMLPLAFGLFVVGAGCEQKGPAEHAGENLDQAAEDVGDAINPQGPMEKAGESVDEVINP